MTVLHLLLRKNGKFSFDSFIPKSNCIYHINFIYVKTTGILLSNVKVKVWNIASRRVINYIQNHLIKILSSYKFNTYINDYLMIFCFKMCHLESMVYPQDTRVMLSHCPYSLIFFTNIYLTPTICQEHI